MSDEVRPLCLPPFPPDYRASGLLLHVTSLPSPYGIGDLGAAAVKWIDQLHEAGQSWWQALPLGPTGYGNSPYQSLSSFAGNVLLISPDWLIEDGLLRASDCAAPSFSETAVDYGMVITFKRRLLERAWINFSTGARPELKAAFEQFCHDQAYWLEDYALFRVLKAKYNDAYYLEWPAELVKRVPASLTQAGRDLVPGPGADFFSAVRRELGVLPFIAEDLGLITPDVCALRDEFQIPGTRVLQFAFDGHSDNPYLPHNYVPNTVVYTGTHDNPTSRGWYEELPPYERQNLWRYLKSPESESDEVAWNLMRVAWSSMAVLAVVPLQDLLNLGPEARMNIPGRPDGNWTWRCTEKMLSAPAFHLLRDLTSTSNRLGMLRSPLTSGMAEASS